MAAVGVSELVAAIVGEPTDVAAGTAPVASGQRPLVVMQGDIWKQAQPQAEDAKIGKEKGCTPWS